MHPGPSRRHFLKTVLAGSSLLSLPARAGVAAESESASQPVNPYANVDFASATHLGSSTHIHCRSQRVLEILYRRGIKHLAVSNYYPSAPLRRDERHNEYMVGQSWFTRAGEGYRPEPIAWNDVLNDPVTGWVDSLPEELRDKVPFEVGPPLFGELPEDVILCPNAEHHSMTDSGGHFNGVGSHFASGNFDVRGKYLLPKHGYPIGCGLPWHEAATRVFEQLQFPDGGGLTINHPVWSGLDAAKLTRMLDFDSRVLGIEIWNQTCEQLNKKGWALDLWDEVLQTGRRCYGFSVSDHAHSVDPGFLGHNVLLLPADLPAADREQACLRAYRNGQFYCVRTGRLRLEELTLTDGKLRFRVNDPSQLRLISALGLVEERFAHELESTWTPEDLVRHRYFRLEAWGMDDDEALFSQPVHVG